MKFTKRFSFLPFMLVAVACTAACSTLPRSGPSAGDVERSVKTAAGLEVVIIDIDAPTIERLRGTPVSGISGVFKNEAFSQPSSVIGAGDELIINLWEAAPSSLFASAPGTASSGGATRLPRQRLDDQGRVLIPFVGQVELLGLSPADAQERIRGLLSRKMNQPQVLVQIASSRHDSVTVLGAIQTPGRYPLTAAGETLLDALAASGGTIGRLDQLTISLTRAGVSAKLPLAALLEDPRQNLRLLPGDLVSVQHQPLSFIALGASGKNGEIKFEAPGVSLAQAVARAGGLLDQRADPSGVFVFRHEKAEGEPKKSPVIYRIDFSDPANLFLAKEFSMRDEDILYVSNAPLNAVQKFFTLIQTLISPVVSGVVVSNAVE